MILCLERCLDFWFYGPFFHVEAAGPFPVMMVQTEERLEVEQLRSPEVLRWFLVMLMVSHQHHSVNPLL
jgi:hypothetical protein